MRYFSTWTISHSVSAHDGIYIVRSLRSLHHCPRNL